MKKNLHLLLTITVCLLSFNLPAQQKQEIKFEKKNEGWFTVQENQITTGDEFIKEFLKEGFSPDDEFVLLKEEQDALGMIHKRFKQLHKGIEVDGADLVLHELDGQLKSFNGKWIKQMNEPLSPSISKFNALDKALELFPAEVYMWEDPGAEAMTCEITDCKKTTFKPDPVLVWYNPNERLSLEKMRLCYKLEIQAAVPHMWEMVYLDAISGELVDNYHMGCHVDVVGTANTKFSGTQQITTDSIAEGMFRLREEGRGGGIYTFNMKRGLLFGEAEDFIDEDNNWDNFNEDIDEAATDCHWGAEKTFDYLLEKHDYYGIDNEGMALVSYVHYDEGVVNAFWNGSWASFGDGNNFTWAPLTCIDVVAHEFAHGITQNTSRLVYRDESGALNESFSDIIGAAVEFYAIPDSADWFMAEDSHSFGLGFRSLIDPEGREDPDTYLGEYWFTRDDDNGGVHTNSSVQNYWFYLLTEGGTGTNSLGVDYEVEGLGLDVAASIAFRNLQYYLTRESQYIDAREGSLQAAADLYGACSNEYVQTARAWQAVGLGDALQEYDVSLKKLNYPLEENCGLGAAEFVNFSIQYNACDSIISMGTEIPIAMQVDTGDIIFDTITLAMELVGGDQIIHETNVPVSGLDAYGMHNLKVWLDFENDPYTLNDTLNFEILNEIDQNTDLSAEELVSPKSSCFKTQEKIIFELMFDGCDSIPAGTSFYVNYTLDGSDTEGEEFTLSETLYPNDSYQVTFSDEIDFDGKIGLTTMEAWVDFDEDELSGNDSLDLQIIANPVLLRNNQRISFEYQDTSLDSLYTITNPGANIKTLVNTNSNDGFHVLEMTGDDAFANRASLRIPNDLNIWEVNERLSAKACICVDATEMDELFMSFDLKQKYSISYRDVFGRDIPFASSLRLLANGEQISQTYNPTSYAGDPFINHFFDLTEYAGTFVEMCFETRNWLSPEFDGLGVGDKAYLDNIKIGADLVSVKEVTSIEKLSIRPNPVSDVLVVDLQNELQGQMDLKVFDTMGQLILQKNHYKRVGDTTLQIDVSHLPKGVYRIFQEHKEVQMVNTFVKM